MPITRTILSYTLYVAGLLFVLYILQQSWPELRSLGSSASASKIGISTLAMLIHTLAGCLLLSKLFTAADVQIGFRSTCRIFYLSQLAKYLPGVIWGFAMQASLLTSESAMKKVVFSNIRLMLFIVTSFLFASMSILFWKQWPAASVASMAIGLSAISLIKNASAFSILPSKIHKRLPGFFKENYDGLRISTAFVLSQCLILYVSYLLAIAYMILAFYDIPFVVALEIALYQSLAWVAGILAFVVPAGIGVREAAFISLGNFAIDLSQEQIQSVAVITRTILIFQDILFSLSALLLARLRII